MRVLALVAGLCLAVVAGPAARAQTCEGCLYRRPPVQPPLDEDHPRLARADGTGPHAPEQVHLAFAGPGAYAVTWVTYPLQDKSLAAAAATDDAGEGAAGRRLAAAASAAALLQQQQLHPEGDAEQPQLPDEQLEAGALERKRRHRRKPKCTHVIRAAGRSVVQYGTQPGEYEHTVESPEEAGCYSSGAYLSGAIHRTIFGAGYEGPLPPNTTVYYRVGDPDRAWSQEYSFVTAPLVGPSALPYRLGLIGDLGQSDHSLSTLDHLLVSSPQSIILTGDLSYADGYQPRWDTWQRLVAPHTSTQVWMYCVGNHEIELTNGIKDFLAYETRFYFPYRHSLSTSKLYYSYDVAGAHIVMLGSYAPYGRSSEQYAWLARDLAGVDRARTPWVVAVQHAPWYNSNYAHQGEGEAMRESMEALLYQYGVDFIFSGHVHAYERLHRVFDGQLDECAPVHINIGDGGNKEGPDKKYYWPQPKFSAFREPSFGHGTLDLLDETHAEWRWHRNQDDGPLSADSASVVRDPDCKRQREARLAAYRARQAAPGTAAAAGQPWLGLEQGQWRPLEEAQEEAALAAEQAELRQRPGQPDKEAATSLWRRLQLWALRGARQLGWAA